MDLSVQNPSHILSNITTQVSIPNVYVVVQSYPWLKFSFSFFWVEQRETKFKPRIKLNHNIYIKQNNLSDPTAVDKNPFSLMNYKQNVLERNA